jgi:RimJ/RimL family protein N-acetyltransferase
MLVINTERLLLRSLEIEDAPVLFAYRSREEIFRYHNWQPIIENDAVDFIKKYGFGNNLRIHQWNQFAVTLREDGILIGDCGILLIDQNEAEIGYTIAPIYQEKGFASEAVYALITYLFKIFGINKLKAQTIPDNKASIKLLMKMGFQEEDNQDVDIEGDLMFILDSKRYLAIHDNNLT